MTTVEMKQLIEKVQHFLRLVDSGFIVIDKSPNTRDAVIKLRTACVAAQNAPRPKIEAEQPDFSVNNALALRRDLIELRDKALDRKAMAESVMLSRSISFIYSAVLRIWKVKLTDM